MSDNTTITLRIAAHGQHWTERLRDWYPCDEGFAYAQRYATPQSAWDACERPDWMMWTIRSSGGGGEPDSPERRLLVRCAAACAEMALQYIRDEYALGVATATIQACYAYAEGEATREELRIAYAAYDAAYDAASAYAAYAAYAADAADSAAADASADSAASAASAYARLKARRDLCDIIRAHYPVVPQIGGSR